MPAQSDNRGTSATQQVVNPFAAKRQVTAHAEPAAPIAVPPAKASGPKTYQNPFARREASPRFVTPRLQPGPLSRWHRADEPPGPTDDERPTNAAVQGPSPAADTWDLSGPLAVEEQRTALFALPKDDSAPIELKTPPMPPDPSHFGSQELAQPAWLVPHATDPTAVHDESVAASFEHARAVAQAPIDPFEATDVEEFVVSDDAPAAARPKQVEPVRVRAKPPVATAPLPRDADEWYAEAELAAADAGKTNELAAVVQHCQRGLECRPDAELTAALRSLAAWACNRSGEIESDQRREDKALKAFELAIQWDPNCWLALHNRAVSRAQQGDLAGALADFNRSLKLNPGLAVAYRNRGELLAATSRTEEAVADYTTALAQMPEDADLLAMRGEACHRLGQYEQAVADLTQSIEIAPYNAVVYAQRGNVEAELGNYPRAIADFRQALAIDAQSAEAYRSLAWLLATCPDQHFRNSRQALASATRAAELAAPGDPFVLDALAAAHANAGKFDRAVRYQQEAIVNVPEDFVGPFQQRLGLYQQRRPFRNGASDFVDENVRAASLEVAPNSPR